MFARSVTDIRTIGNVNSIATKDGREREIEWYDITLKGADGKVAGVQSVGQDITARKEAEEQRRSLELQVLRLQSFERLGVLAVGIAHDFNNLLMIILGNMDIALPHMSPISPVRPHLEAIKKASHRAGSITNQMVAYSGRGAFQIMKIDLGVAVGEMMHLEMILALNLPSVEGDFTQIRQVGMNLVINACEAIGENTTGEVVFDPFYSTKFTGRGLGLATVLGIVQSHRGAIMVESEAGKGSTFTILFPALEEKLEKPESGEEPGSLNQAIKQIGLDKRTMDWLPWSYETGFAGESAEINLQAEGIRVFPTC